MSPPVAVDHATPKVCYLLKRFPRLSQTFVLNELLELERQGVTVTVLARRGSGEELTHDRVPELRASVRYLGDDAGDDEIASAVVATGADHIHAHFATWAADAAMRVNALTSIPYSFTAHARDIHHITVDPSALADRIEGAGFVVTVSDANRRHLEEILARHDRTGRVVRIYNGVDVARLGPRASDRDPRLIVAVGRLVEKKGFGDLVEACRILSGRDRELRLAIVGDGELRAKLERQIADSGLGRRAHLLGARPAGETLELIASAAVLVLPCVVAEDGDRDGLPTVILEAMALATPVVSTDLPGVPEMIEDGVSGRIVAQHDPAALADVLDELLVSPVRRAGMAQEALAVARRRFDLATNVGELVTLFRSSIGDGP